MYDHEARGMRRRDAVAAHLNMLVILNSWRFNVIIKEADFSAYWAGFGKFIIGAFAACVVCSLFLPTRPEKKSRPVQRPSCYIN